MVDAIKAELDCCKKEKRDPRTSNVIRFFRPHMKPEINDADINRLFDIVFNAYLHVTGHPTEYHNN